MKFIKGLIPGALFFISILIAVFFFNSFLQQAPRYFSTLLIAGSAVVLFYLFRKWDKTINRNAIEISPASPEELEEAYFKLAEAKTSLLNKEESLRKFSRIIEQSPTSIVITDIKGNIEYVNPRFCEVTGYTYEEAIGQNPRILKSGEISLEGYKELWQTITSGETWRGEFHNRKKDGTLYWEFAHIAPVKNQLGKVTHFIAVKENITTKKAIDETRKMYAKALHSIRDMVILVDLKGNILYVNDAFCTVFKYSEKQIFGKNFRVLLPADTSEKVSDRLFNSQNFEGWNGDIRCITRQGQIFYTAMSTSAIKDEKEKTIAYASISRDLTEERTVQENKRKADMLATVQELAGSVSHEFSQPLQALNNYISLLKMGRIKKEYLNNSELAINRIAELVDNLAEITSIQKQDYLNSKIIDLKASALKKQKLAHKRILVVDDEEQILETVPEMLSISGYECDGAADGLEALQKISKQQYQLIISDINMPRMSGIRLFEKLQTIGYKGAFVFLTGYSVPNEMNYFMNEIDGLLNKPVDMHKLIGIVKKILGKTDKE